MTDATVEPGGAAPVALPVGILDRLAPLARYWPALALVAVQLVVFPMPLGPWVLGVVVGLLASLVALGMGLIYRANRVLNFAQADLGTVPATVAVGLIAVTHIGYFVGLAAGLVVAVALGALVELLVIRRFFRSPRLLLMVATIGLSQLFIVAGLLLPRLWGQQTFVDRSVSMPGSFHLTLGVQRFGPNEITALVVAPLLIVALALYLRGTDVGVAIRASAERADRAALLGIPVRRVQTLVWVIASVLSFVGVFLHASIFGITNADALSPASLMIALAALVLGRLDDLPAIGAAAIALGIVEQGVAWNHPNSPGLEFPIIGIALLVVLVLRRASRSRSRTDDTSSWRAAEEIRPVPIELRDLWPVRLARWGLPLLGLAAAVALPSFLQPSQQHAAAAVAAFAIVTLSVVVLTGWAGQISLGQMSFVAVGAVAGALVTTRWHGDISLALLVAGAAGAVVAVVVGLPALRLRGFYLAVSTLAFALASSDYLLNRKEQSWIPQSTAAPGTFVFLKTFDLSSQRSTYFMCLGVMVVAFLAVAGLRRSRTGRVLVALRDNEAAVQSYGVGVTRAKLTAFAISGFLAAMAGCLMSILNSGYSELPYTAPESLGVLTAAVVGGLGSILGALIGALFLGGGQYFLDDKWRLLPSAGGVLLVLLFLPGGLGNLVFRARDGVLRALARRRGIVVASLVADVGPAPEATVPDLAPDVEP
ncbi:MAG TPA: ABC transporter permease [Acidimicrobiales bacterium]